SGIRRGSVVISVSHPAVIGDRRARTGIREHQAQRAVILQVGGVEYLPHRSHVIARCAGGQSLVSGYHRGGQVVLPPVHGRLLQLAGRAGDSGSDRDEQDAQGYHGEQCQGQ
ncbi:MAG: hypothetical protein JW908_12820, partial [Anaerolineales bacterium]|nr:hypothetical protein [Anaerolineales bacterium]